jgi:pimeloyl-ACP methyl ester carboxylesterase
MGRFEHTTDGVTITFEYDQVGSGPPVVLAHALAFTRWYDPLVAELDGWSVLRSRRTVSGDSDRFGIDTDAAGLAALTGHLGIEQPHVVGHSYGGLVALALVRADPDAFASLALLEPAPTGFLPPDVAGAAMAPLFSTSATRGPSVAMHDFLRAVCGDDGVAALDVAVPGAVADADAAAPHFFDIELPAVAAWDFDPLGLDRVDVPVLDLLGSASSARFVESAATLQRWLPTARHDVIDGAGHALMATHPREVASHLEALWRGAG